MIYRTLGRTGERVSVIGLGGWHIGQPSISEHESIQLIRRAIDCGITFMDNCWDYNEGASQVSMGKALKDSYRSFEREVLPVLNHEGIAPLGMKVFGHPYILYSNTVKPIEALHYCLNLPIAVQITGIDSQKILDQALEAVCTFKPLTQAEATSLLKHTRYVALEGKYELYKTSTRFDGTQRHPEWLGEDPLAG
ncbi:MAG: aldo/keto reductase [Nitrospirota bacterium]